MEAARFHVGQALRQASIDSPTLRGSVFVVSGWKLRSIKDHLGSQNDSSALHGCFHQVAFSDAQSRAHSRRKRYLAFSLDFNEGCHRGSWEVGFPDILDKG